jgi:NADH-quinone oxidoreductase subunit N
MIGSLLGVAASSGFSVPHIDYTAILPELILMGGALVLLCMGALTVRQLPTVAYSGTTAAIGAAALVSALVLWTKVEAHGPFTAIAKSLAIDGFSTAFVILAACVVIVAAVIADGYLVREQIAGPEYHALALLGASGAMFMATANDLIVIFLGLEIMSIPLYILAGMDQRRTESGEAAMKYFVLGAFSSAIFVYGIALTYGATGSTNLAQIAAFLANNVLTSPGLLLAGAALLLVGFGFKIAAVPFHMWTPDVYQGAPTPATGFMAAIAKVGGFAAFLRVFFSTFHSLISTWQPIIWVIAILTLAIGAVLGLVQRDIKRMLAYSSINHAGFVLLGLEAATTNGVAASLYYVFVYAFLVLGSFAVIGVVGRRGDRDHDLDAYRGLGRRQPALALAFAILLLAQAGAPFTTGFLAKLYVVQAAVGAHSYALAVVAMLSGAVAAAFYLRVVFLMYGAPWVGGGADVTDAEVTDWSPPERGVLTEPEIAFAAPGDEGVSLGAESGAVSATATLLASSADPAEMGEAAEAGAGEGGQDSERLEVAPGTQIGIFITVAVTIVFGVWPGPLFAFAHAASLLF